MTEGGTMLAELIDKQLPMVLNSFLLILNQYRTYKNICERVILFFFTLCLISLIFKL